MVRPAHLVAPLGMKSKTEHVVLSQDQQTAFNDYLRSGGAYIGVHSASDCLQNTAFYNQTVGAIFDYHPPIQQAVRSRPSPLLGYFM